MAVYTFNPVGLGDETRGKAILFFDEGQVFSIGWVEVILTEHEFEDDRVFLGLEKCRVTKVGCNEG